MQPERRATQTAATGAGATPFQPADLRVIRRWPSAAARTWVEQFTATACASALVDAIVVIGSAVRAHGHRKSDLDLIVIYNTAPPATDDAPIDVDIRVFPREQVDDRIAEGHDLLGWAIHFGVAVCDHGGYWADLATRWRHSLPWPSPAIAVKRATRTESLARELLASGDEDAALELATAMLTHRARAHLLQAGIYPASRPELPEQLRATGAIELADRLAGALDGTITTSDLLDSRPDAAGPCHE
jgi:predicted nucleotidyltransferase